MNPEQKNSTRLLIEALEDVCQTVDSPTRPVRSSNSGDSGFGSAPSNSVNNNKALEQFIQNIDQGTFTAAANSLNYLLTIYTARIKNNLDPLQFDKASFKASLNQPLTDQEVRSLPAEAQELHDSIKELHGSLQKYAALLLKPKFARSQTNLGELGHKRNQYLDQINSYLFKQVPTLYPVLTWSYRFVDNQPLAEKLSCLEILEEQARAVVTQLSITDYNHTPMHNLFRVQAKIWRDEASNGDNLCLTELMKRDTTTENDEQAHRRYLNRPTPDSMEIKKHHRFEILIGALINKQTKDYQEPVAKLLFST